MMETETPEIGPYFAKVGPEIGPNADQLTALTRGRGPRRGNLEDLLKYWRPIMKKPGGFRRCVVILMDKPQFGGRPQRICAWLHHELTGKWPNEGNHHGRGGKGKRKRRGKLTRRVRSAARKAKSVDLSRPEYSGSSLRYAVSESRAYGGILVQPIAGRQNVVDMKAAIFRQYLDTPVAVENDDISVKRVGIFGSNSRFGQAAQAVGSTLAPGNTSVVTSPGRSAVFRTLTPGGGSGRGRRLAGAGRRLLGRSGRGARNRFRCPPGFENGGTFTDRRFSTCGAQILGIPNFGPGSLLGGTGRALARLARNAELISSIGDLRSQKNPGVFIRAAQIPSTPKKVNVTARATGVNTILNAIGDTRWNIRVSKRDGVILEPVAGLSFFANQTGDFDDVVDGSLVVRNTDASFDTPEVIEAVQSLNAGFKDVYFAIPEVGVVRVGREGGELTPAERTSLTRTLPTRISRDADIDPTAGLRGFADDSGGKFVVEFGNLNEQGRFTVEQADNQLVKVQGPGGTVRQVPQWVYETFLSRSAPRRAKDDPIFELVPEGKSVNPFFIAAKAVQPDTLYKEYQADIAFKVDAYKDQAYLGGVNFKRVRPGGVPLRRALGGLASAVAFFDPSISRYRCPPGFTGGGQLTNVRGSTCGRSLSSPAMLALGKLQDARGKFSSLRRDRSRIGRVDFDADALDEDSFRAAVLTFQTDVEDATESFLRWSRNLPDVDELERSDLVNLPPLTDADRRAFEMVSRKMSVALAGFSYDVRDLESLDEPTWNALVDTLQDFATVEAQRQLYLEKYGLDNWPGTDPRSIDTEIVNLARELAGVTDGRVVTRVDDVTEEGANVVSSIDQALETAEALLDANGRDELWSVTDLFEFNELYYDLLDRSDIMDTSPEFFTRLDDALYSQLRKYDEKIDEDPDSLSLEEYGYLLFALRKFRSSHAGTNATNKQIDDLSLIVSNTYLYKQRREFGELDLPLSERSDDALVYVMVAGDSEYGDITVDKAENAFIQGRIEALKMALSEAGVDTDKISDTRYELAVVHMLNNVNSDVQIETLLSSALSGDERQVFLNEFSKTNRYIRNIIKGQRSALIAQKQGRRLDNFYRMFLTSNGNVEAIVYDMPEADYENTLEAVQALMDSLAGVYEASENWGTLRTLRSRMKNARESMRLQTTGEIKYLTDDPELLPDRSGIPRWLVGFRNRQKQGMTEIVQEGLKDLDQSDYDIVDLSNNETTEKAVVRLKKEGKFREWTNKLLLASDASEAERDPSKRSVVAEFRVRADDGEEFLIKIDNVIFDGGYPDGDLSIMPLQSYFYATVIDKDGNEVIRELTGPDRYSKANVVRRMYTSGDGEVDNELIVVNSFANKFGYEIRLPDGRTLMVDNRGKGIADKLNQRFMAMSAAAGIKKHTLTAAWDGQYVWPRRGVRSSNREVIKNLDQAFNRLVGQYDRAKESIAAGRRLTGQEAMAWLMFNGDDRRRDRVAMLLNFNLGLGDDPPNTVFEWAQHTEFIHALEAEADSIHEVMLRSFFKGSGTPLGGLKSDQLFVDHVNSLLPEGSPSRLVSVNDLQDEGFLTRFLPDETSIGPYIMGKSVLDFSVADIDGAGCKDG